MDKETVFSGWYYTGKINKNGREEPKILGRGGFGTVYEIEKRDLNEATMRSALKVISIPHNPDEIQDLECYDKDYLREILADQVRDAVYEIKNQIKMQGNANIVRIEDYCAKKKGEDEIGFDLYIRMELLHPIASGRKIKSEFETDEVIKLGIDICNALEECHSKNILHRDVKPQNILKGERGKYKLGDFGISRVQQNTTGVRTGTNSPEYAAPEAITFADTQDKRSDLYSLGLVMYHLLNKNTHPFLPIPPAIPTKMQFNEAYGKRIQGIEFPVIEDIEDELNSILRKACSYKKENRFESAREFREALEHGAACRRDREARHAEETNRAIHERAQDNLREPESAGVELPKESGNSTLTEATKNEINTERFTEAELEINKENVESELENGLIELGNELRELDEDLAKLGEFWESIDWDEACEEQGAKLEKTREELEAIMKAEKEYEENRRRYEEVKARREENRRRHEEVKARLEENRRRYEEERARHEKERARREKERKEHKARMKAEREMKNKLRKAKKRALREAEMGGGIVCVHGTTIRTEIQPVSKFSGSRLFGIASRKKTTDENAEEDKNTANEIAYSSGLSNKQEELSESEDIAQIIEAQEDMKAIAPDLPHESEDNSKGNCKRIAVIGVGDAGCNTIKNLVYRNYVNSDFSDIDFIAANTRLSELPGDSAKTTILFGQKTCRRIGAAGNPEIGVKAVEEDEDKFKELFADNQYHTVVVVCGLGGGTGSGAAPEICRIAKQEGAYTAAIVGYPFSFEGKMRNEHSSTAREKLKENTDILFVSKNDNLLEFSETKMTLNEAYQKSDELYLEIIKAMETTLADKKTEMKGFKTIIKLTLQKNDSDKLIGKLIENLEIYEG